MRERNFSLNQLIGIAVTTRLFVDTGVQLFYPFLRVIAKGMGITEIELGRLLSLRSFMGLVAPLFGAMAERRGNRAVMRLGLLFSGIGYLIIGSSNNLWLTALGVVFSAMGTIAYLPSIQAYLSARLPYSRRAWGLGIVEYAWALSGIVGLFLMGQLIAATNWRVPLYIIGAGMLVAWVFYRLLPTGKVDVPAKPDANKHYLKKLTSSFTLSRGHRSAWFNSFGHMVFMFAEFNLFIVYGAWLDSDYSLGPLELGTVALVIGIADLIASVLVSAISDRLGKRKSVLIGLIGAFISFTLLPLFDIGLYPAIIGLLLIRFFFEFAVVSNIALLSEQVPTQRAKMMGLATAFGFTGTAVSAWTGPWLLANHDILGVSVVSAIGMAVAIVLIWQVKDPGDTVEASESS